MVDLTWTDGADFDGERDIAGIVHDGVQDHPAVGTLQQGYNYHTVDDLYSTLYGSNLVGWWPLHESSGQANDLSGGANHGSLNGGPTQGVGGRGALQAYSFDGSDDYISTSATGNDLNFPCSISLWFRADETPNWGTDRHLLQSGWVMNLRLPSGGNNIEVRTFTQEGGSANSVFSNTALSGQAWYHVVFVFESGTVTFYVNGSSDGSGSANDSVENNPINISHSNNPFLGEILDVRIYNTALSQSQIQTLYEWGSGDYANPADSNDGGVSYYDFNGGTAADQWGSNDGTVSGATHVADGGPRGDGAYSFDGSDDDIDLGTVLTNEQSWTFSVWAKPENSGASEEHLIAIGDDGFEPRTMFTWRGDHFSVFAEDGAGDDLSNQGHASDATTDAWYNVTWTRSGGDTVNQYRNGHLIDSASGSGIGDTIDSQSTHIGSAEGTAHFFEGDIDEVRIYNRALEPWEVQELYQYGTLGRSLLEHTVNI